MTYTTLPYATPEQVYSALALSPAAQAADAAWIANDLLPQAQDLVDEFVGFPFQTDGSLTVPSQRVYSGNENTTLLVDNIQSVVQVLEISQDVNINYGTQGAYTNVSYQQIDITTDILIGPDNRSPGFYLTRVTQLPFFFGRQNYIIKGVWGYPTIPSQITRALIRLVVHWYKMRDFNYTSLTGNNQYGYQKFDMGDIPPDAERILRRYRLPVFLAWES